jgi:uncharacterized DUF497 family protein
MHGSHRAIWHPELSFPLDRQHTQRQSDGPFFIRRSDRHDEIRYQVFGLVEGREIAVACAFRGDVCWRISARRARKDERRKYYDQREGRSPPGED